MSLRSKHDPIAGYGIPNLGKLLLIGAVEIDDFSMRDFVSW